MTYSQDGIKVLRLGQSEREQYGCIVNFSDGSARWFPSTEGITDAANYADRKNLKITTISTPETIYRDLQGQRGALDGGKGRKHPLDEIGAYLPEHRLLAVIRRGDLFEPNTMKPIPGRAGWRRDAEGREWYSDAWLDA